MDNNAINGNVVVVEECQGSNSLTVTQCLHKRNLMTMFHDVVNVPEQP